MKEISDINYLSDNNPMHCLDMYLPSEGTYHFLIYFHGGGLHSGDRKSGKRLIPLLSENIAVVSAEYRMLPDADFPDFIEDAAAAVKYVYDYIKQNGLNSKIYITGASAGAYITMFLALDRKYLENVGVPYDAISGFISESSQQFSHFNLLKKHGLDPKIEHIDETAPIFYVKRGLEIGPMLLIYYSDDMVCRPEENMLMYRSMLRFIPENNVLKIAEVSGKHIAPDNINDLLKCMSGFIKEN